MKSMVLLAVGAALFWVGTAQEVRPPELAGSWALLMVTSEYWNVPFMGERQRVGQSVVRLTIEQDGNELLLKDFQFCLSLLDTGTSLVRVQILPSFYAAIEVGEVRGRLEEVEPGWLLVIPPFVTTNGVRLSNPFSEPLPTSAQDPRVVDSDTDGKPGVTTRITVLGLLSGEAYVVQRSILSLQGVVSDPNFIRGILTWKDEQVTLAATSPFLSQSAQGRPDPILENSYFILRRIRGDETCEEIVTLFAGALRR